MATLSALTDGTGVSALTGSKILKDVVADFLLTIPAVLIGVGVTNLDAALAAPMVAAVAAADTAIRVIYRAVLRWATS